ncbi:MAG: two-component system, response regulator YesN [Acidobacteriota bacterium]|jgi:AraC-like DNA-binding protein|nr:two-component system, response regulator YesN [Acidobacteriota bacterium]
MIENKSAMLIKKQEQMRRELDLLLTQERPDTAYLPREIAALLDFIHGNLFDSTLNVSSARSNCRIRNNNISARFRTTLGVGIREYIEALRLEGALRLLRDRRFEVYLIAMAVGYEHQETFCRAFQRHFGCPPSSCQ